MTGYIAPLGSDLSSEGWKQIGIADVLDFHFDDDDMFVPYPPQTWTTSTVSLNFTMSPEASRALRYMVSLWGIRDAMRQDLEDLLDAFAARWGINR